MMSVVLITGGTGFISSFLSRDLLRRGYDVVLYDVAIDETLIKDFKDKVKIVKGDIVNSTQLAEAVKTYGVDTIVHYAALKSSTAEVNPALAYKVNFEGLWNIFEVARANDVGNVIFASSVAAYGPGLRGMAKEDVYTVPHGLYGISKQLGEMVGLWFFRKYGIEFVAFRYGSVIGPGRRNGGASAYSTLMIQKPAQHEPYSVNVAEASRIPLLYVKDAVDATLAAYERIKKLKSRIYNLASLSPSPSAKNIAESVRKRVLGAEITFKPDKKTTEIIDSWPTDMDITRAKNEFGWEPKYSSLDALTADFVAEVQLHPDMYTI